jgi:2-C-methyl-D-erythritol 4-phosphate cytidylyltransferase
MVEWSLEAFAACGGVGAIVVAVPPELLDEGADGAGGASSRLSDVRQVGPADGSTTVVAGGATRAQSVSNALEVVETEFVAIHDAARPLVTPQLIEGLTGRLEEAPEADAVIPATPITDTVKRASTESMRQLTRSERAKCRIVLETLDRSELWGAQTPQVFRTAALREALQVDTAARDRATDEAMLIEQAGGTVLIHPSSPENLKVTTPLDLRVAELLLADRG